MTLSAQDMAQEEADAVAALMAAASGDIRSEAATDTVDQSPPGTHLSPAFLAFLPYITTQPCMAANLTAKL